MLAHRSPPPERFRANRLAGWSLWLFAGLLLSLGAELIANDKPLLLSLQRPAVYPRSSATPSSNLAANCRSSPTTAAPTCAN
jgi:ABC-type microcin C transport system permease subunit YejE